MIEIIKQAREQKAKLRLSFAEISRRSGIEVGSVKNFLLYEKNVRFSSAVAILSVLNLEIIIAKKDANKLKGILPCYQIQIGKATKGTKFYNKCD